MRILRLVIIYLTIILLLVITAGASGPGTITADDVNMRAGPSLNSDVLMVLYSGTPINIHGTHNEWYEVDYLGVNGYIYSDYVSPGEEEVIYTLTVPEVTITVAEEIAEPGPNITTGQTIVDTAMKYLGTPYLWGGDNTEEGFDCSGLVHTVYLENGININRTSQTMVNDGIEVSLDELELGDILLFGSPGNLWHVGIYIGDGNYIHSAGGIGVITQAIAETYNMGLVTARRVLG